MIIYCVIVTGVRSVIIDVMLKFQEQQNLGEGFASWRAYVLEEVFAFGALLFLPLFSCVSLFSVYVLLLYLAISRTRGCTGTAQMLD
jgi:hypothetical protein